MKAIMYHYVRPIPEKLPFFKHLHLDDFRRQLDFFQSTFRFASREELSTAIAGGPVAPGTVVLTFDDGLSDHSRYVVSELLERDLWGIFYVPAGPYLSGKLMDVHRVHVLLGRYGGGAMMDALKKCIRSEMLTHDHIEEFRRLTYTRQKNTDETNLFKRTLNYYISTEWRESILDALMTEYFGCEDALVRDYYMPRDELKGLQDSGMIVGSHSVSHPVFSKLSVAEQKAEIDESFDFLDRSVGGLSLRTFCYPYGGFHSFTADTEWLLTKAGCKFSFNVEPRAITDGDFRSRPQALPRFDCNMFPFGKASCNRLDGAEELAE